MSVQTSRPNTLEESEIFHILGNDRRRAIVQLLAEDADRVDVSEVASEIAARESDSTPVPNNLYKSVYVSLQQTHLPQLEEDDVIEYDAEAKTIHPGPQFDQVFTYIEGSTEDGRQILEIHLALSLVALVLVVLAGVGVPGISSVGPVMWTVLALIGIAASSLFSILR